MIHLAGAFLGGVATWSFLEYALHNWVMHGFPRKTEMSREHLAHHQEPTYFAPTPKKILAALKVLVVFAPLTLYGFGVPVGGAYLIGFYWFYTSYEVLHRRIHTHAPNNPYSRYVRKHHLYHHFGSPKKNHGVTSPIWDIVFQTYVPVTQVRVPDKHRLKWMCSPETGAILDPYRADYILASEAGCREVVA